MTAPLSYLMRVLRTNDNVHERLAKVSGRPLNALMAEFEGRIENDALSVDRTDCSRFVAKRRLRSKRVAGSNTSSP